MARQRFIWPSIWDDPDLASISVGAHLLYIACFSLADDEGRIDGNPVYLRSQAFPYRVLSNRSVKRWRDEIANVCSHFVVYEHNGREYIAFQNWSEFQKPKYPSPSKLPPPPPDSGNDSGKRSGNDSVSDSGNDSPTGRVGKGKDKSSKQRGVAGDLPQPLAAEPRRLLEHLKEMGKNGADSEEPSLDEEPDLEPEPSLSEEPKAAA